LLGILTAALPLAVAEPPTDPFVIVPPGKFLQGSPPGEPYLDNFENQRVVYLTRAILVQSTEVTQAQWTVLMEPTGAHADCGSDCPVGGVSFWQALEYANRLSISAGLAPCYSCREVDGGTVVDCGDGDDSHGTTIGEAFFAGLDCPGYRLPTDSEWEYFARAGTTTAFPWGGFPKDWYFDGPVPALHVGAWFYENSGGTVHPVGQRRRNGFDLYDTHGNVSEWVWGGLEHRPYDGQLDPVFPWYKLDHLPIVRGGSYAAEAPDCRSAARLEQIDEYVNSPWNGLRLVRTAP
jgi:formylglycine-generating enzyme required for sulfatase activity